MSHDTDIAHDARIEFRVRDAVAKRVDALAAYGGHTRSQWMRLAVVLVDSEIVLAELDTLEMAGPLGPERERTRAEALAARDATRDALGPAALDVTESHFN